MLYTDPRPPRTPTHAVPEASLEKVELIQNQLARQEQDLQKEIDSLKEELRRDHVPSRMQLLQEMISVRNS